ncbi:MAG: A24 family peptidase [Ruminococcus sp.]|nr:A24 family peptidase [Ruminococcus sp.]
MLYSVITVVLWTIVSVIVVLLMAKVTNKRISEESGNQKSYKKNTCNYILLSILTVVSAICAWFVSQSVISVFFCIEMGLCYIATLGAAVVDFKLKKIPNIIPAILFSTGVILVIIQSFFIEDAVLFVISSLIGCMLSFCILFIAGKVSKGGIGMGDVKLISAIGLTVGVQAVFTSMIISLLLCLLVMGVLRIKEKYIDKLENAENKQHKMAFAPFLYFGFTIMIISKLY